MAAYIIAALKCYQIPEEERANLEKSIADLEGLGYLISKGLPPLGQFIGASRQCSKTVVKCPFDEVVCEYDQQFGIISGFHLNNLEGKPSRLWKQTVDGTLGSYNSEAMIRNFVAVLLVDIEALSGIDSIQIMQEVELDVEGLLKADCLVFRLHGCVVGMVEAKKLGGMLTERSNCFPTYITCGRCKD